MVTVAVSHAIHCCHLSVCTAMSIRYCTREHADINITHGWNAPRPHVLSTAKNSTTVSINWSHLFTNLPVEDFWKMFRGMLQDLKAKYVPKKTMNSGNRKPIWMTYRAVKTVKHCHSKWLYNSTIQHPTCHRQLIVQRMLTLSQLVQPYPVS